MARTRALLAILAIAAAASSPGQAAAAAPLGGGVAAAGKRAKLKLRIVGLPPGARASVIARGRGHAREVRRSSTLHLEPGSYRLRVRRVKLRRARGGVPAGSVILPVTARRAIRLRAGRSRRLTLRYGTVVDGRLRRVDRRLVAVVGPPTNPGGVVLRGRAQVRRGTLLNAEASKRLPAGLLHRVVAVRRSHGKLAVSLEPAHLAEAFPQLDVDSRLALSPSPGAAAKLGAAGLDPLVASLGIGAFRCSLPLADSRLHAGERFRVGAHIRIHVPKQWGIAVGPPEGRLALTLAGSASLDALIRKNAGCSASVKLPPLAGVIPVGPAVVPVYAQGSIQGTASVDRDLGVKAGASVRFTAGMTFRGLQVHNISGVSGSAGVSASGAGKLSIGPNLRVAVGVPSGADVHFDAKPAVAVTASGGAPRCKLDLTLGSQVGISLGPFQLNQNLPAPTRTLAQCKDGLQSGASALSLKQSGPLGAFPDQDFDFAIAVKNPRDETVHGVEVVDTLPASGSFVSGPAGSAPGSPSPGGTYTMPVGDIPAHQTRTVSVRWRAPSSEGSLTNSAVVRAPGAPVPGPATATVPVGTVTSCNPCGATAAGTGLHNREHGSIAIGGVPPGAKVERAVLIWSVLYDGAGPPDAITFQGHRVSAEVTGTVSGNLCWGDSATVGYAVDVTEYVNGNGTYEVTDPPRGLTRADADPAGVLPYTDGATLVVLYDGGGSRNQVVTDFNYNTNTDASRGIHRSFSGIHSVGGPATLTLAGPNGQNYATESFTLAGAGEQVLPDTFDGSDPQDGPSFDMGNLWDTDSFDVTELVPAGQQTLDVDHHLDGDCIGVGAAVLQVSQQRP